MSKKDSMQKRRAQNIRCQVKKEYDARISELREKVILRDSIIEDLTNKLKDAHAEIARLERRSYPSDEITFYARSILNDVIGGLSGEKQN